MRMKPFLLLALLSALVLSSSLNGAIVYEFRQTSRSDFQTMPPTDISGKATLDGSRSRVDFTGTSMYGENVYVVSHDGSRSMTIVDPSQKLYSEVDFSSIASSLGNAQISVSGLRSDVKKMPGRLEIAGFPTEHYRLEASYEMTLTIGGVPLRQQVETVVEKWTTSAFGDVGSIFLTDTLQTGNPQLDQLLVAESTKIPGLPLRQVITITTTALQDRRKRTRSSQVELLVSAPRRQTSELLVSSVRVASVEPTYFSIPAGYRRVDGIKAPDQPVVHTLTLQPQP